MGAGAGREDEGRSSSSIRATRDTGGEGAEDPQARGWEQDHGAGVRATCCSSRGGDQLRAAGFPGDPALRGPADQQPGRHAREARAALPQAAVQVAMLRCLLPGLPGLRPESHPAGTHLLLHLPHLGGEPNAHAGVCAGGVVSDGHHLRGLLGPRGAAAPGDHRGAGRQHRAGCRRGARGKPQQPRLGGEAADAGLLVLSRQLPVSCGLAGALAAHRLAQRRRGEAGAAAPTLPAGALFGSLRRLLLGSEPDGVLLV
mmetsp:Transcript_17685/g.42009  ORF Transcript_17685/g.42009 Transcript_17685/m.42009 type:complete len:257 (+) Transcript_17685:173-943(+)